MTAQLDLATLHTGLDEIRRSPTNHGTIELIVRRPAEDQREILTRAYLDTAAGLIGDDWLNRGSASSRQVTLMNARVVALIAGPRDRWALAGDQLYLDLDLSTTNVPPGTRLTVGSAVVEVTDDPHRGCKKFAARFGLDALRFVNSPIGCQLGLRGVNARVVHGGLVQLGDPIRRFVAHGGGPTRHAA